MALFSLKNTQAYGVEATLEGGGRVLSLRFSPKTADEVYFDIALQPGKWHSLTLVAEKGKVLSMFKDRIQAFRDGIPKEAREGGSKFKYPGIKSGKGINMGNIGRQAPGKAALAGQLGLVALFSVAATPKEVEALHASTSGPHAILEPALAGVPSPSHLGLLGGSVPPRLVTGKRGKDSGFCFALDARRCEGAVEKGEGRVWSCGGTIATERGGDRVVGKEHTRVVMTTTFSEALASLGGPIQLLPLLVLPAHVGDGGAAIPLPLGGAGLDPSAYAQALAVFAASLQSNEQNRALAVSSDVVHTLAVLIANCPRSHLTLELLIGTLTLVRHTATHPQLHGEATARLLFDMRLWTRAPPKVQVRTRLCPGCSPSLMHSRRRRWQTAAFSFSLVLSCCPAPAKSVDQLGPSLLPLCRFAMFCLHKCTGGIPLLAGRVATQDWRVHPGREAPAAARSPPRAPRPTQLLPAAAADAAGWDRPRWVEIFCCLGVKSRGHVRGRDPTALVCARPSGALP